MCLCSHACASTGVEDECNCMLDLVFCFFLHFESEHALIVAKATEGQREPGSGRWPYINTPLMLSSPLGLNDTS